MAESLVASNMWLKVCRLVSEVSNVFTPSAPGITSPPISEASFNFLQEETIKSNEKQKSIKRIDLIVTRVFFGINSVLISDFICPQGRYTIVNSLLNQTPHYTVKFFYREPW